MNWRTLPEGWRESVKRAAYLSLAYELPPKWWDQVGTQHKAVAQPNTIAAYVHTVARFANWLDVAGVERPSDVTGDDITAYAEHLASGSAKTLTMEGLQWFAAFTDYLQPVDRLAIDPVSWDDAITLLRNSRPGTGRASAESRTPAISPATLGPLMWWALQYVLVFASDILIATRVAAAIDEALASAPRAIGRAEQIRNYQLARTQITAECGSDALVPFDPKVARARFGLTEHQANRLRNCIPADRLRPAYLTDRIDGRIEGQPWTDGLTLDEIDHEAALLTTACLIVIAYLVGVRPEELLNLERDCLEMALDDPSDPHGTVTYYVNGLEFPANASPQDQLVGRYRDVPWVAIKAAADAIEVMQTLIADTEPRLFAKGVRWRPHQTHPTALSPRDAATWIQAFTTACNKRALRFGLPSLRIPADPRGRVTIRRLRRTLGWYVANQPHGTLALGIQYGHTSTKMSQGYAARGRDGLHDVINLDKALALRDQLAQLQEDILEGAGVSGPAARDVLAIAERFHEHFAGQHLSETQLLKMQRSGQFTIYDDPDSGVACVFKPDRALCIKIEDGSISPPDNPSFELCQPNCGNLARTDRLVDLLKVKAQESEEASLDTLSPEPLRKRHEQRAANLRRIIDDHDANRLTRE